MVGHHLTFSFKRTCQRGLRRALLGIGCALTLATSAMADIDQDTPSFFIDIKGGHSVYKSQMVQSNDTGFTVGYGVGVYAGSRRTIGFILSREMSTFAFGLNNASIAVEWQDMHMRYRMGPFYTGLVLTNSSWVVTAPPDADGDSLLDQNVDALDYMNVTSTGYGANLGLRLPVARRSEVFMDLTYAAAGAVRETATDPEEAAAEGAPIPGTRTLGIGPRMDLDLGGAIAFNKWLKGLCGFRYRVYQVSVEGEGFAELHTTTYLGLRAGWQF